MRSGDLIESNEKGLSSPFQWFFPLKYVFLGLKPPLPPLFIKSWIRLYYKLIAMHILITL